MWRLILTFLFLAVRLSPPVLSCIGPTRKPDLEYQEGPVEAGPTAIPEIRNCFRRLDRAAYRLEFAILQDLITNAVLQKETTKSQMLI